MIESYREFAPQGFDDWEISDLMPIREAAAESSQFGVYLIYREDKSLIYIGASDSNVGARLWAHVTPKERASDFWKPQPAVWAEVIFPHHRWEVWSFEKFLEGRAQQMG